MLRIHKIVKVMDSPKRRERRERLNKHLRKRSKVISQRYLTFMDIVRLVEERYAGKYKP